MNCPRSVRLGILFFLTAFSDLFGTPIQGALLGPDNTFWYKGILFSAVSRLYLLSRRKFIVRSRS